MANPITQIIISAVDRTKAAFASAKGGLNSIGTAATALRSVLANLFVGLSVVSFIGAVKRSVDSMDDVSKAAKAAGTSVEKFSGLAYAAGQSGVGGVDALQKTLAKLSGSLNDARDSTTKAAESWRNLGIDPTQFSDPADALLVLADRFAAMPDGIKKTALAIELFGEKLGPKLIPLLNQGRAGIQKLTDEARDLGKVIGDEAGAAAEQFNDSLDRLKASSSGLGISIANKLIPSLNQYVTALDEITRKGSVLEKIAFFTTGFISEDVLNRITNAGDRVQDYNLEIGKLQQQLLELRRVELADSPNIRMWEERIAALDKTRAQLIERAKQERAEAAHDMSKMERAAA